jgi:type II secretory pathway pseudopilin PulG
MNTIAKHRGHTLIELLISSTLFLLILILMGELAVRATTTRNKTEDKNQVFREATVCLDNLQRDLLHTSRVYSPGDLAQGIYHPGNGDPVLVVAIDSADPSVIGYRYDRAQRRIARVVYQTTFDPGLPATQIVDSTQREKYLIHSGLEDFSVTLNKPSVQMGAWTIDSDISVSTGTGPNLRLGSKSRLHKL